MPALTYEQQCAANLKKVQDKKAQEKLKHKKELKKKHNQTQKARLLALRIAEGKPQHTRAKPKSRYCELCHKKLTKKTQKKYCSNKCFRNRKNHFMDGTYNAWLKENKHKENPESPIMHPHWKIRSEAHLHGKRPVKYRIVISNSGKEYKRIGNFRKMGKQLAAYNNLKEQNKKILFPVRYKTTPNHSTTPQDYEVLLLYSTELPDAPAVAKFPNQFGKLIEHKIGNSEQWIIQDKFLLNIEETFRIFGMDSPEKQKNKIYTAQFILDNYILTDNHKELSVFRKQLIIRYDDFDIDIVYCKNREDAARLLTFIEDYCTTNRIYNILFMGFSDTPQTYELTQELIQKKTNYFSITKSADE